MKKHIAIISAVIIMLTALCGCSPKTTADIKNVDIDLTTLSSTVVYSEVYNMMLEPDNYIGKKVKMRGTFSAQVDNETGKTYVACVVADATACCQQGIEFQLADESKKYPEDYPELETEIEVVGDFNTYNEGELQFIVLQNAIMNEV